MKKTKLNVMTWFVLAMITLMPGKLTAQNLEGNFNVTTDWGTGYCAEIKVVNNSNTTINGWTLNFNLEADITSFWNISSWSGNRSQGYTASDAGWNSVINPGASVSVGFCANYSGSIQSPTNADLNGLTVDFGGGGGQTAPVLSINSPANGAVIQQNTVVNLQADATDSDGTITSVVFNVDGQNISATNSQGNIWQADWSAISTGNYTITATATDNDNLSANTSIQIVVQNNNGGGQTPPVLSIISPSNAGVIQQNSVVNLQADATDSDGTIISVDFNVDGQNISATNSQGNIWQADWSANSTGNFIITATATDNDNLLTSTSIQIFVQYNNGGGNSDLTLSSLPLQINFDHGSNVTYVFDQNITSVLSRNLDVVSISVSGNAVTFTGINPGRTGLRIISGGQDYFMGLRVNNSDGSIPGMPDYLSVGSVSEDSQGDLAFWKDINTGQQNKSMDIRYIYINGGPLTGWQSWGPNRPETFATESVRSGLIPFFVYYNIPDGGESYYTNTLHINDVNYMTAYFNDLNNFMNKVETIMQGDLYGIILEPDFLGYIQQNGNPSDPNSVITCVAPNSIAPGAGTVRTLVERINKTINDKRLEGHNIFYGWQLNLWSYPITGAPQGVIRLTDQLGFEAGRAEIHNAAEQTALYGIQAGVLSNSPNFLSIDKYGLDAMGHQNTPDPANSTWFFNNDHWMNYLYYAKTLHQTSGFPIILWQLPVGHINNSQAVSSYTGSPFVPLSNTNTKYEDSSTPFFLGDTYTAVGSERLSYFTENLSNDPLLQSNGNTITWGSHMQNVKDAGIISTLFGAGVGPSTDGIGAPPTDDYFWIQKVQDYYLNGPVALDWSMFNIFQGGSPPNVSITSPQDGGEVVMSQLSPIDINITAWDLDGQLTDLNLLIDGQTFSLGIVGYTHSLSWTPNAFGTYVITANATDNDGLTATVSITFSVIEFSPGACGVPIWEASTVYAQPGSEVSWDGNIYQNKWWTLGDLPGSGGWTDPWKFIAQCSGNASKMSSSVGSSNSDELKIALYPNPTKDMAFISLNLESDAQVKILLLDLMGRSIREITNQSLTGGSHTFEINTNELPLGIYVVRFEVDNIIKTKRLVKN